MIEHLKPFYKKSKTLLTRNGQHNWLLAVISQTCALKIAHICMNSLSTDGVNLNHETYIATTNLIHVIILVLTRIMAYRYAFCDTTCTSFSK